jgi:hypothetical protein
MPKTLEELDEWARLLRKENHPLADTMEEIAEGWRADKDLVIEECLNVIRYCEDADEGADDPMIHEEWKRGQVDACHAIKAHFGLSRHWLYRENGRLVEGDHE